MPTIQATWPYWWATFTDRAPAAVYEVGEDAARAAAEKLGAVAAVKTLPYPAAGTKHPDGTPDFCYGRGQCAGRTACPQPYSCTE